MLRSRDILTNSSTLSERLVTPLFRLIEKLLLLCDGIVWAVREFFGNHSIWLPRFAFFLYLYYDFGYCWGTFYYVMKKKKWYSLRKMGFLSIAFIKKKLFFSKWISQVILCGNFYSKVIAWLPQMIRYLKKKINKQISRQ